jgi:hypothetical protein
VLLHQVRELQHDLSSFLQAIGFSF